MKEILILKCSDPQLWYSKLVGKKVPFLREYSDCFMSREPTGFANIVRKEDGKVCDSEEII